MQNVVTNQIGANKWIKKLWDIYVYIHSGILCIYEKRYTFVYNMSEITDVTFTEINLKETNKYHMISGGKRINIRWFQSYQLWRNKARYKTI